MAFNLEPSPPITPLGQTPLRIHLKDDLIDYLSQDIRLLSLGALLGLQHARQLHTPSAVIVCIAYPFIHILGVNRLL